MPEVSGWRYFQRFASSSLEKKSQHTIVNWPNSVSNSTRPKWIHSELLRLLKKSRSQKVKKKMFIHIKETLIDNLFGFLSRLSSDSAMLSDGVWNITEKYEKKLQTKSLFSSSYCVLCAKHTIFLSLCNDLLLAKRKTKTESLLILYMPS